MTKYFHKTLIKNITNDGCEQEEVIFLLELFADEIKFLNINKVKEASWDNIKDFSNSQLHGVDHFSLKVERSNIGEEEQWCGNFVYLDKRLTIIATLEKIYFADLLIAKPQLL